MGQTTAPTYAPGLYSTAPNHSSAAESFTYNVFNRLVMDVNDKNTVTYAYNPDGLRMAKTVTSPNPSYSSSAAPSTPASFPTNKVITSSYWDRGNIVAEDTSRLDTSGGSTDGNISTPAITSRYIRGINLIRADFTDSTVFYLYNAHGDVVQLTDKSGAVIKNYHYNAFGVEDEVYSTDGGNVPGGTPGVQTLTRGDDTNAVDLFHYSGEYFDLSSGITLDDLTDKGCAQVQDICKPGSSISEKTIVFGQSSNGEAIAATPLMELSTNTVYILELDYWADNTGCNFYADLYPDDSVPNIYLYPTKTVQKLKVEISSPNACMLNTALRLIRYGSVGGNVYVSNLRFYNKQTVESGKYLNNTDNGKSIKDFDYFWKTDKIQTAIPGTSGNVSTVEALKMSYVYGTGSGAYMQNKLKLNTTYELSFYYWTDTDGILISACTTPGSMAWVGYTPKKTVQRADMEIHTGSDATLLIQCYGQINGNIFVSDVILYEKDSLSAVAADQNPFRYCGEYWDRETGTYYLRARYYVPSTGRFLSQDPARHGLNYYTYCSNNPVNRWDPTGLTDMPAGWHWNNQWGCPQGPKGEVIPESTRWQKVTV